MSKLVRTAVVALFLIVSARALAQAQPAPTTPRPSPGQLPGKYLLYVAGLFVPPDGGRLGLAGSGEIGHDYVLGRIALAPGLRLAAYFGHEESLALSMVTLRCMVPLALASPFLSAGAGPAYRGTAADLGAALQLGAGLQLSVSSGVTVGVEASYLQLTSGAFRQLSVGPLLRLAL